MGIIRMAGSSRETPGFTRAAQGLDPVLSSACTSKWACWLLLVQNQAEKTRISPFNLRWESPPFFYIIFIFSHRVLRYTLHYEAVIKADWSFTSYFPKHILMKVGKKRWSYIFIPRVFVQLWIFLPSFVHSWEGMQMWRVLSKETGNAGMASSFAL